MCVAFCTTAALREALECLVVFDCLSIEPLSLVNPLCCSVAAAAVATAAAAADMAGLLALMRSPAAACLQVRGYLWVCLPPYRTAISRSGATCHSFDAVLCSYKERRVTCSCVRVGVCVDMHMLFGCGNTCVSPLCVEEHAVLLPLLAAVHKQNVFKSSQQLV
ncbi:hypothetical protein Agub_g2453 [Astrephomene gubernaculifera]|uniref:Uncharacterized protein n=1 Tax=Astrephomene gubernaculifera TaxID=47775 RepID=A0AAD3HHP0_9CHLO|nr:hypothetical protein Agub_g2453 [Astrephomene gubernaculifera]